MSGVDQDLVTLIGAMTHGSVRIAGEAAGAVMTAALERSSADAAMRARVAEIAPLKKLTGALSGADYDIIRKVARSLSPAAVVESGVIQWLLGGGRVYTKNTSGQIRHAYVGAIVAVFDTLEGDPDDPPPGRWSGAAVARLAVAALEGADATRRANLAAELGRDLFGGRDSEPNSEAAGAIVMGAGRRWIPADAAIELLPKFTRSLAPPMAIAYVTAFGKPTAAVADMGKAAARDAAAVLAAELVAAGRFNAVARLMKSVAAIATILKGAKIPEPDSNSNSDDDDAHKENSDAVPMEE